MKHAPLGERFLTTIDESVWDSNHLSSPKLRHLKTLQLC